MSLDLHPEWWRRMVKIYWLWVDLPEVQGDRLINLLSEVDQEKFEVFLRTIGESPRKVLRDLEKQINHGELYEVEAFIDKLPKEELIKLAKAGLNKGTLISNIDKMGKEELQELVEICSLPKNFLVHLYFYESLDATRKRYLTSEK